jgi:creatinine amidohydrolase
MTHLLPRQLRARREAFPVAWLPLGTLEWHGRHLPLGQDGVVAEGICLEAATALGGVVFPPVYYGDHRGIIVEAIAAPGAWGVLSFDHRVECCRELGVSVAGVAANAVRDDDRVGQSSPDHESHGNDAYTELLERSMWMIRAYGFTRIVVLPGHGGVVGPAHAAIARFNDRQTACRALSGFDAFLGEGRLGHADAWETSLMLYFHPELVHREWLADDPADEPIGLCGHASRFEGLRAIEPEHPEHGTRERGKQTVAGFIAGVREALGQVPPAGPLADPDEDGVRSEWVERVLGRAAGG